MNMKHLMMNGKVWIGAFTVFAVLVIVFAIIIPMMRENSVLGHGNPTKQKLMVIDQDTGAISFVTKSLQGINDNFTQHDDKVLKALKTLLGDNLDNFAGYEAHTTPENGALWLLTNDTRNINTHADTHLKKIMGPNLDWEGTREGYSADQVNAIINLVRAKVGNIRHSDQISLLNHTDFSGGGGGGWGDYAIVGFGDHPQGGAGGSKRTGLHDGNVEWGNGKTAGGMKIHSRNKDNNTNVSGVLDQHVTDWNKRN